MSYTVINPANESIVTTVEHFGVDETDAAVERAVLAQQQWATVSPRDKGRMLRAFAAVVDAHREELAQLETANSGHPISQSRGEAENVRDVLEYYSGAPERLIGQQIPVAGGMNVTFHEPIGVVGVITPWNFPMTIGMWGVAPALAAGNAVVLKPAEWTPLTSMQLEELGLEAGLPEGLFQVLPGKGSVIGDRFMTHPAVRKIVFTGSTEVGKLLMQQASQQMKRITLELGGKSANIIFDDADVAAAAAAAPFAVFDNAGQDCCARSRILVQRNVMDEFLEGFEQAVHALRVGDPLDESTQMGPLVTLAHRDRVTEFMDYGDEVLFRGSCPEGAGAWFAPTVMRSAPDSRLATEEIFGPIVSVMPFDTEEDALRIANASQYGLSGSLWTRDLARAVRVSRGIETGTLSVNSHSSVRYTAPFGGVKESGLGRELGPDAALEFTETKSVFFANA